MRAVPVRAAPVLRSGSPARRPGKGGCGVAVPGLPAAPGGREPARDAWVGPAVHRRREGAARLPGGSWALRGSPSPCGVRGTGAAGLAPCGPDSPGGG